MAGIDHTIIFYKNGKVTKEKEINYKNFNIMWDRDAQLYCIKNTETNEEIRKFKRFDTMDYHYEKRYIQSSRFLKSYSIREFLSNFLPKKKEPDSIIEYFKSDDLEIINLITFDYNALYIFTDEDTYAMVGGYGHIANPYTHFYHRGYGEQFENKMVQECYEWLCEDVLKDQILRVIYNWDEDEVIKDYWEKLNFKSYWDMTDEERKNYYQRIECA